MRFHLPSFMHYFRCLLPYDISILQHQFTVYLYPQAPLRRDTLQEMVTDAVLQSCEKPLGAESGTEQRSLLEGLPGAHYETLHDALLGTDTYLSFEVYRDQETGEKCSRYEYRIDLQDIQEILIAVRRHEDVKLAWPLVRNEVFISFRLLAGKLYIQTGKAFSNRRLQEILETLEYQGKVRKNGHFRTEGREVIR